jgi:FAD/FMN-containing dehydrogenase
VTGSSPSWQALQGGIAGEVVLPGSPADQQLRKPFNARFHDVLPQATVLCATPEDVAETISFAQRHGLACAPRSGGHCFVGRSVTRGLVIDVTAMGSVSVSGDLAVVDAGARLDAVYEALEQHQLTIPAGTCPPVGVAGPTLGVGWGSSAAATESPPTGWSPPKSSWPTAMSWTATTTTTKRCSGPCAAPVSETSGW